MVDVNQILSSQICKETINENKILGKTYVKNELYGQYKSDFELKNRNWNLRKPSMQIGF